MSNNQRHHRMPVPRRLSGGTNAHLHQEGAVLVVGLIILVLLTLLGVQAMRGNVSQERMAFNMRERNVAFQAAEAALRVGENMGPFDGSGVDLVDATNWAAVSSGICNRWVAPVLVVVPALLLIVSAFTPPVQ